jgi:hypothetical protein
MQHQNFQQNHLEKDTLLKDDESHVPFSCEPAIQILCVCSPKEFIEKNNVNTKCQHKQRDSNGDQIEDVDLESCNGADQCIGVPQKYWDHLLEMAFLATSSTPFD